MGTFYPSTSSRLHAATAVLYIFSPVRNCMSKLLSLHDLNNLPVANLAPNPPPPLNLHHMCVVPRLS